MSNEQTKALLKSIKEDSKEVNTNFINAAYAILAEKVKERKMQISKTMFASGKK